MCGSYFVMRIAYLISRHKKNYEQFFGQCSPSDAFRMCLCWGYYSPVTLGGPRSFLVYYSPSLCLLALEDPTGVACWAHHSLDPTEFEWR